jgi:hypothetical protein
MTRSASALAPAKSLTTNPASRAAAEIQGMSMALVPETQGRDPLAGEQFGPGIGLGKPFRQPFLHAEQDRTRAGPPPPPPFDIPPGRT